MNKKSLKKALGFAGIGLGVILLSSCTANFCSQTDLASIAYPYEQGVTVYLSKTEYQALVSGEKDPDNGMTKAIIAKEIEWSNQAEALGLPRIAGPAYDGNDTVYKYIPYTCTTVEPASGGIEYKYDLVSFSSAKADGILNTILKSAQDGKYAIPSVYYFGVMDDLVLKQATMNAFGKNNMSDVPTAEILVGDEADLGDKWAVNPYTQPNPSRSDINNDRVGEIGTSTGKGKSILRSYGSYKFAGANEKGEPTMWKNYDVLNDKIRALSVEHPFAQLSAYSLPSTDFVTLYKTQINTKVTSIRSCIATRDGNFGHYGYASDWRVAIEKKDWGYAWQKGFIEGLLVYPVSWLLDTFAYGMDPALSGAGQIWALIFVTLIVRGLLLLATFRSTADGQKMQMIQPELAKIQAKYPNSNTNMAERQRMSQEQMALYKRHNIHPMRQFLIMFIQFPVFIAVWAGLQGASALATGEVLNMSLSDTIQQILFNTDGLPSNLHGWWTALFLFILMAIVQIFAMLLPRILAKRAQKKVGRTTANPAQDKQNNTMKWVAYGMMIFTIVMGFMLPSAMGVYWLIGGLISIAQTSITQLIMAKRRKKGK